MCNEDAWDSLKAGITLAESWLVEWRGNSASSFISAGDTVWSQTTISGLDLSSSLWYCKRQDLCSFWNFVIKNFIERFTHWRIYSIASSNCKLRESMERRDGKRSRRRVMRTGTRSFNLVMMREKSTKKQSQCQKMVFLKRQCCVKRST